MSQKTFENNKKNLILHDNFNRGKINGDNNSHYYSNIHVVNNTIMQETKSNDFKNIDIFLN